jgi:hypothetical protein
MLYQNDTTASMALGPRRPSSSSTIPSTVNAKDRVIGFVSRFVIYIPQSYPAVSSADKATREAQS